MSLAVRRLRTWVCAEVTARDAYAALTAVAGAGRTVIGFGWSANTATWISTGDPLPEGAYEMRAFVDNGRHASAPVFEVRWLRPHGRDVGSAALLTDAPAGGTGAVPRGWMPLPGPGPRAGSAQRMLMWPVVGPDPDRDGWTLLGSSRIGSFSVPARLDDTPVFLRLREFLDEDAHGNPSVRDQVLAGIVEGA